MSLTKADPPLVSIGLAPCPLCGGRASKPVLAGRDRFLGTPGTFLVVACERCGLHHTHPRLSGRELASRYPEDYEPYRNDGGGRTGSALQAVRRTQMNRRLARPPLAALSGLLPGRLLDVGCGRGDLAAAFARRGWRASGLDPSVAATAVARGQGVEAVAGTLEDARWPEECFDAAILYHSLEHVPDPVDALARVSRLLKTGGVVAVAVPDFGSWQRRRFGSRWFHLDLPRHLQHFDAATLAATARAAGLAVVDLRSATTSVGLPGTIQYRVAGRCVARSGTAATLAQGLAVAAYPLTMTVGRLAGGDALAMVAAKPGAP